MATITSHITRQQVHESTPANITVFIPHLDMVLGWIVLLVGLALPVLMAIGVITPGFFPGLLAFLMVLSAGTYLLIRSGEIT